jgi:hypothetical protein
MSQKDESAYAMAPSFVWYGARRETRLDMKASEYPARNCYLAICLFSDFADPVFYSGHFFEGGVVV